MNENLILFPSPATPGARELCRQAVAKNLNLKEEKRQGHIAKRVLQIPSLIMSLTREILAIDVQFWRTHDPRIREALGHRKARLENRLVRNRRRLCRAETKNKYQRGA